MIQTVSPNRRGVTLLWALRSPCNLQCLYCYFGTGETPEARVTTPGLPGTLSHNGRNDVPLAKMLAFIRTFSPGYVRRVFLAGGEPLVWQGTQHVVAALKQAGCEVILCTNGLPLQHEAATRLLLDLHVDAVSVSLDSFDAASNDRWRQDRSGQGWAGVVKGIQTLLKLRNEQQSATKVGVYAVITQQNLDQVARTGRFVADLGADYFVVQPVSLAPEHALHADLCMDGRHRAAFIEQIRQLHDANLGIQLAHPDYLTRVITTMTPGPLPMIQGCFGGRDLFFIEPDGSVWDCPSALKIHDTPLEQHWSITSSSAEDLFSTQRRCRNTDCTLFSQDCVNMWQLMSFDTILSPGGRHEQFV